MVLVLKASLPSPVPDFDVLLTNPPFSADETSWHAWPRLVKGLTVREIVGMLCYYGFTCLAWVFDASLTFRHFSFALDFAMKSGKPWFMAQTSMSKHHWLAASDVGMLWLWNVHRDPTRACDLPQSLCDSDAGATLQVWEGPVDILTRRSS